MTLYHVPHIAESKCFITESFLFTILLSYVLIESSHTSLSQIYKEVIFILYQQISNESIRLEEQIHSIKQQLKQFPAGNLICTHDGKYLKWYQSDGHTQTYIPKKNRTLAEQLAAKKYLSLLLNELSHEKKAIEFYLRHHTPFSERADKLLIDTPEYQDLLLPFFTPLSKELAEWQNASFASNPKHPEQLTIKTCSGFTVRSKSEALIDMALFTTKIPHRYECELQLDNTIIYPDFTLRHPRTGNVYYWEHFGLMDDPFYCKKMANKLELYARNGIVPSINLITTYETSNHPLSPDVINRTIETYFS